MCVDCRWGCGSRGCMWEWGATCMGGHGRVRGCMWYCGLHNGWVVSYIGNEFHEDWTAEEVKREVGLVGMEDENVDMVVWRSCEVAWAAWWWYEWVVKVMGNLWWVVGGGVAIMSFVVDCGCVETACGEWAVVVRVVLRCRWSVEVMGSMRRVWVIRGGCGEVEDGCEDAWTTWWWCGTWDGCMLAMVCMLGWCGESENVRAAWVAVRLCGRVAGEHAGCSDDYVVEVETVEP